MSSPGTSSPRSHSRPKVAVFRWRQPFRMVSAGAAVATIVVSGGVMLTSTQEASASTLVNAAVLPDTSPTHEMPGMDHGTGDAPESGHGHGDTPGMDMSGSTPTPTMTSEMPGMGHGSGSTPTPSGHDEMPGMEHGSGSTPTPTMTGGMPGMEHGSGEEAEPGHDSGGSGGHGATEEVAKDRPLVPVLGTFGGGASAVMLAAGFLRRKDRAANAAKAAARAARRSAK